MEEPHDRQPDKGQADQPDSGQIEDAGLQQGLPGDPHQHGPDHHHGQGRGDRADIRGGLVQELREGDLEDLPGHPQEDGDDTGIEKDIFALALKVGHREQGEARRPHHDPVGDDEDRGVEEPFRPIDRGDHGHPQEPGVIHQGAVLEDALFFCRIAVIEELAKETTVRNNNGIFL